MRSSPLSSPVETAQEPRFVFPMVFSLTVGTGHLLRQSYGIVKQVPYDHALGLHPQPAIVPPCRQALETFSANPHLSTRALLPRRYHGEGQCWPPFPLCSYLSFYTFAPPKARFPPSAECIIIHCYTILTIISS